MIRFGGSYEALPILAGQESDASKPTGFAFDLSNAIAETLGVEATWQNTQWPGQIPALQAGGLDAIMGQISVRNDREESVADMIPFFQAVLTFLVEEGNPTGITAFDDACGHTVAAPSGSAYVAALDGANRDYCLPQGKPAIQIAEFNGFAPGVTALRAGTVDAVLNGKPFTDGFLTENGSVGFEVVSIPLEQTTRYDPGLLGVAVSKANPDISQAISGALKQLKAGGQYDQILEHYSSAEGALTAEQLGINILTGTPPGASK